MTALISILALSATQAFAALDECNRVTAASHGGERAYQDMGRGKVLWVEWWSQEGVYDTVWLADCRTGIALDLRTHEERITDRVIPDQTEHVLETVRRQAETAPAFFTIERVAQLIRRDGRGLHIQQYSDEFCGCAQAYPEMRGDKEPFGFEG